jgi:hypothetical protein
MRSSACETMEDTCSAGKLGNNYTRADPVAIALLRAVSFLSRRRGQRSSLL